MAKNVASSGTTFSWQPLEAGKEAKQGAEEVRKTLNSKFGDGTFMKLGDVAKKNVPVIPTGIFTLDNEALGIGGVARGRVIEVYGPESSGKTTITLQLIAQAQEAGGQAAFIDAEHALDPTWAGKQGVRVKDLFINQPDYGEQALEILDYVVKSGAFSIVVVDSVAALTPKAELEGEMGDSHVGLQARMMSQALRKITSAANQTQTTIVFINQIREKIGVMFGNPETTTGGRALKFFSSQRIDVRRIGQVKDGDEIIGNRTKFKIVKNKQAAPFRETEVDLLYASGYNVIGNAIDAGVEHGLIEKSGAWYSYKSERIGQGINKATATFRDNPDLYKQFYKELIAAANKPKEAVTV